MNVNFWAIFVESKFQIGYNDTKTDNFKMIELVGMSVRSGGVSSEEVKANLNQFPNKIKV